METKHLIWIGAGGAILPFFDFDDFDLVTLVEARSGAVERLRERFKNNDRVKLEEIVISDVSEETIFFNIKPETFSQVGDISNVRELFPNIAIKEKSEITTTSLVSLFEQVCSDNDRLTIVFDLPSENEKLVKIAVEQSANYTIEGFYVLNASESLISGNDDFKLVGRLQGDVCGNYLHFFRDPELLLLKKQLTELHKSSTEKVQNLECEIEKYRNNIHTSLATNTSLQQKEFAMLGQKMSDMLGVLKSAYSHQGKCTVDALKGEFEKIAASIASNKNQTNEVIALFSTIREQLKSDFVMELAKVSESFDFGSMERALDDKSVILSQRIEELKIEFENRFEKILTSIASNKKQTDEVVALFPTTREQLKSDFVKEFAKYNESFDLGSIQKSLDDNSVLLSQCIEELKVEYENKLEKISASIASNKSQTNEIFELLPTVREQLKSEFVSELDKVNKAFSSVSDNSSLGEKLEQLNSKVEELAASQRLFMEKQNSEDVARVIRNIPFLLQKTSYNTSKQIESFISLNKYINHHELPLSFHGWPISPDIGLTLIDYIENKNVDIVLEFGSGTSSVLFAKAFKLANSDTNNWCLKLPIISFEHNEEYLEKTSELLSSHNCRDMVNLTHAPLIDFEYNEQEKFLYYDCEEAIKRLSDTLGDNRKTILVLIDGPPGVTNKNARFPALPILLNHMSKHRLILVMDDYSRDDEKQTFELWQAMADKRYLSHSTKVIETEKGLAILTIN